MGPVAETPGAADADAGNRGGRWGLGLALLVAFGLRVDRLGDYNLWWDEGYSVYLARKGLLAAAIETAGDVHPPLHYWLLHYWLRLVGESEFALRFSSVWFAVLSVALLYWLGRRWFGARVAPGACWVLVLSRFHVEWSQQIRMYTLMIALTIVYLAVVVESWRRPRRWHWPALAGMSLVGLYTLYLFGLGPLVASGVVLACVLAPIGGARLPVGYLWRWVGAHAVAVAAFAPWVWLFTSTPRPTPKVIFPIDVWTYLHACATAFPVGISAYLERYSAIVVGVGLIVVVGAGAIARTHARLAGLLAASLLVPPVVVYALSFPNPVLYAPNLSVRYLILFIPAYAFTVAAGLAWLWRLGGRGRGLGRPVAACVAAGLMAVWLWALWDYQAGRRLTDDFQTVADALRAYERPGDVVILNSDRDWPIYEYHYGGSLPRIGVGSNHPIAAADAEALVAGAVAAHPGGVWLLTSDYGYDSDPTGLLPAALGSRLRLAATVAGQHRSLALYTADAGRALVAPTTARMRRPLGLTVDAYRTVVGADLSAREAAPGETLRFAVYWQTTAGGEMARPVVELTSSAGVLYRRSASPGGLGSAADSLVRRDQHELWLPAGMPPGTYRLSVGLDAAGVERRLAGSRAVTLGTVYVRPLPTSPGVFSPRQVLSAVTPGPGGGPLVGPAGSAYMLGGKISIDGYDVAVRGAAAPRAGPGPAEVTLRPGEPVTLKVRWRCLAPTATAYTVFVQLVGLETNPASGNRVWAQRDAYPVGGKTDSWLPAQGFEDSYELTLPAGAPTGVYWLIGGMYDADTGMRLPVVGVGEPVRDHAPMARVELLP